MPRGKSFDYLTPADWKGLSTAGVTKRVMRNGSSTFTLDFPKLDAVLAQALLDSAQVESVEEFNQSGLTMVEIVINRLQLPNVLREQPTDKRTGEPDDSWTDPFDAVAAVVGRRLRSGHTSPVQAAMLKKGLILFSGARPVTVTYDEGLEHDETRPAYAVTRVVSVIERYVTDPEVADTLRKARTTTAHWGALADAVPEAAGRIIETLSIGSDAYLARREAVYKHAIAALSEGQRAALEAELSDLAGAREPVNLDGLLALTGGSVSTDTAA